MAASTIAVMTTQTWAPVLGAEDGNRSVRSSVGLGMPMFMAASRDSAIVSVVGTWTNCVPFEVGFLDHMLTRVDIKVPFWCRREWTMFPANLITELGLSQLRVWLLMVMLQLHCLWMNSVSAVWKYFTTVSWWTPCVCSKTILSLVDHKSYCDRVHPITNKYS